MKELFFILLISYSICSTQKNIFDLNKNNKILYNNNNQTLTVLDLTGIEGKYICITYKISNKSFEDKELHYEFSDNYPNHVYEPINKTKENNEKKSSSMIDNILRFETKLFFNIVKQEYKYLILLNLKNTYGDNIEVEIIKSSSSSSTLLAITIICSIAGVISLIAVFIVVGKYIYVKRQEELLRKDYGSSFVGENPSVIPPEETENKENNNNGNEQLV